ncbi:hypothetical protein OK18_02005 [Chryseobacterium gallinarum]|uniref:Uncharacterized protein n=1 Tax=Chryseobacterium gallinarum TaxID=1324352 RepID=A0A0G3LYZ1_CHRGL|nr:hypothetical protein [Chryseobacterium gallinarum]AKK71575.1 hypothetical protein OK18_02005 [Chryseobacterium gallinarum]
MADLRGVKVTEKYSGTKFEGKFHIWFTKSYDTGETFLYAIIENNHGKVDYYDLESYDIEFLLDKN